VSIVKDQPTCYLTLGALHGLYKPVPGKFKDYIAIPKANGYQSLHTTLIGPYGTPVEVQIRTREMHHIAESGVASHWLLQGRADARRSCRRRPISGCNRCSNCSRPRALRLNFSKHVKVDLFPGEVFVFTPKGKILGLPRGATAVDFAYAVHTDVGNRCVACRINTEPKPLRTELRNGDQVEIICAAHANPNPSWLTYVRSSRARAHIRHFLKVRQNVESTALGERLLAQALLGFSLQPDDLDAVVWGRFVRSCGAQSKKEVVTDIGLGKTAGRHRRATPRR